MQASPCPISTLPRETIPFHVFVQKYEDIVQHSEYGPWVKALSARANCDDVLIQLFQEIIVYQSSYLSSKCKTVYELTLSHTLTVINHKLTRRDYFKIYAKAIAQTACKRPESTLVKLPNAEHAFIFPSYPLPDGSSPEVRTNILPLIAKSDYFYTLFSNGLVEKLEIPSKHYDIKPEVFQALVEMCLTGGKEGLEKCFKAGISKFIKLVDAWNIDEGVLLDALDLSICKKQGMKALFILLVDLKKKGIWKKEKAFSQLLTRLLNRCVKQKRWESFFEFIRFALQSRSEELINKWLDNFFCNYRELSTFDYPKDFFEELIPYIRGIPRNSLRIYSEKEIKTLFSTVGQGIQVLHISKMAVSFTAIIPFLSKSLMKISFSAECRITEGELVLLSKQCPNIEMIKITSSLVKDLGSLSGFSKLQSLSLHTEVERISLKTLPPLPLKRLDLSAIEIAESNSLIQFKSTLKFLRMTRLESFDCVELVGLELEKLSLSSKSLENIMQLGELDLTHLQISKKALTDRQFLYLQNALPDCYIRK